MSLKGMRIPPKLWPNVCRDLVRQIATSHPIDPQDVLDLMATIQMAYFPEPARTFAFDPSDMPERTEE